MDAHFQKRRLKTQLHVTPHDDQVLKHIMCTDFYSEVKTFKDKLFGIAEFTCTKLQDRSNSITEFTSSNKEVQHCKIQNKKQTQQSKKNQKTSTTVYDPV